MRRLIIELSILILFITMVIGVYLRYASVVIEYTMGPGTERQIDSSFNWAVTKNYDLLILGSSKFYRGINPDKFSVPAFNFGHDNDAYNQMYYKLLYLKTQGKKFRYLILSIDYAPFSNISDTRNHIYKKYFDPGYFEDYRLKKISGGRLNSDLNASFDQFMKIRFSMTFTKFIESIPAFITRKKPADIPFMRSNGQYIKPGRPSPDLFVNRQFDKNELQEEYFSKILDHCHSGEIVVFLVMPPFLKEDIAAYPDHNIRFYHNYFDSIADKKYTWYLDYSSDIMFSEKDFTGLAHLNEKAADKFTVMLNEDINSLLIDH